MAVTPDTQVTLLKCPIELDNMNQLTFTNTTAQYNYFNSLPKLVENNFTYQRKDGVIRFPAHIDSLLEYNYVMYQNTHYSNKWFYCFITRMEYVNDSLTLIYIKTDTYQTWQFDLVFKQSFVEREHVSNDTIGAHTVDEGLELGDFVANSQTRYTNFDKKATCVAYTRTPSGDITPSLIGSLFTGVEYTAYEHTQHGMDTLVAFLNSMAGDGLSDNIVSIFQIPEAFVPVDSSTTSWTSYTFDADTSFYSDIFNITRNNTIDGYTPKNNKLFTSPFNYLMIDNGSGNFGQYKYELFENNLSLDFTIRGIISPGCSITLIPNNYKLKSSGATQAQNYAEQLNMGKLATCAWSNDAYTNWLAQNSWNVTGSNVAGAGSALIGAGLMFVPGMQTAGLTMMVGGAASIYNTVKQEHQATFLPNNIEGNLNGGDIMSAMSRVNYTFYTMSIRKEKAQIIDNYLTMFGYKVSTLKVPNRNSRRYWNYIKTIDANIEGNIPQDDIQEIKNMFNSGITLWHDASHFLDYSQNNTIV